MLEVHLVAWRILAAERGAGIESQDPFGAKSVAPVVGKKSNFSVLPERSNVLKAEMTKI